METPWLDIKQAAEYLNLSVSTLYSYVAHGSIPYSRVPGSTLLRFETTDLNTWLRQGQHNQNDDQ